MRKLTTTLIALTIALQGYYCSGGMAAPLTAKAALLLNDRGKVLYQHNPYLQLPPASTTKVLTALIVLERCNLDETVRISPLAASMPPSAIGVTPQETFTVEELLYALLLHSANDAATALAEHVADSESGFARLMNEKAKQIGATHSHFANPHGLPAKNHYTTAYDLAQIMKAAMNDPRFVKIAETKSRRLVWTGHHNPRQLVGKNRLLASRVIGKTGFTFKAKYCYVGSNRWMTMVLLGSDHLWTEARQLLSMAPEKSSYLDTSMVTWAPATRKALANNSASE